jgi:alpha-glucosidase
MRAHDWWRGAVIYQIYLRSFCDSNDDGVGDLPGVIARLDYLAGLGVDAIWITPFMRSPQRDFGYDVSDHRDVDPLFGTLADFDRLLAEAHRRGLRVLIDFVPAHTSDQHPWFLESRAGRSGPKADFYVWRDPRPDGTPPNNWLSIFGGPAWQWEPRRAQYYLHHFLPSQPALNLHEPAVLDAVLAEAGFWLARGVDGLRLDAINYCLYDKQLRDNPPRPLEELPPDPEFRVNPYRMQLHRHDKSQPENLAVLRRFRALSDRYPGVVTLGEVGEEETALLASYTQGTDRLHLAYNFALLRRTFGAAFLHDMLAAHERAIGSGWTCWAFSNHDVPRVVTRWGGDRPPERAAFARLLLGLLLSLRGSACIYQGEELGLPEAEVPYQQLRDPWGLAFWPVYRGRDGCRTPMPWQAEGPGAGFTGGRPWLPIPEEHRGAAVDLQERDPDSVLHAFRRLLAFRRQHPALRTGALRLLPAPEPLLAFTREGEGERLLLVFNLGPDEAHLTLPDLAGCRPLTGHGFHAEISGPELRLPGYQALFAAAP